LRLGQGKGPRRQLRNLLRHGERVFQQILGLGDLVDPAAVERGVRVIGRAAERNFGEIARRHRKAHDLEGERGKRDADQQFGHADAARVARHNAPVGTTGKHAAPGNRVAVDRRHERLGMEERRVVESVQ